MIIDTPVPIVPHIIALKAAGVTSIIRYLDPIGPHNPKNITPAEAAACSRFGLRLGLVSEGWGDFAHGAISAGAGERDAEYALKTVPGVGAPANAVIAFAVDTDATQSQIGRLVLPYFVAIRAAMADTKYQIMVYGSGAVCAQVLDAGLADLAWLSCSMGWTGSKDFLASNRWALRQHLPTHIAGIDCDPNDVNPAITNPIDFVPVLP